jgi:hypothetical protein
MQILEVYDIIHVTISTSLLNNEVQTELKLDKRWK